MKKPTTKSHADNASMTTLAVSETVSLSKMDSPAIVDHIVVTLSTSMVRTLEDLKPYILEIWRRLDEGEVIRFASDEYHTRKEFCSGVLGRTYRAVHYMLNDGNQNRSLPPIYPKGRSERPLLPDQAPEQTFLCPLCEDQVFTSPTALLEHARTHHKQKAVTINTYPENDYSETQIKATSRSHGPGLERLRKLARENQTVSYSDDQFHIVTRDSFDTESKARKFLKQK